MTSTRVIVCSVCDRKAVHKSRGWCSACYTRWLAHGRPADGPPPRRTVKCGTSQGWDRHIYRQETACDPCRAAHREAVADWAATSTANLKRTRHFTDSTPRSEWTEEQRQAAHTVALATPVPADRRLLLEALGLAPASTPPLQRTQPGAA